MTLPAIPGTMIEHAAGPPALLDAPTPVEGVLTLETLDTASSRLEVDAEALAIA